MYFLQVYFVDHNNRTTQFTDPRLNAQILSNLLRKHQCTAPTTTTSNTAPVMTSANSSNTTNVTTSTATTTSPAPMSPRSRTQPTDVPSDLPQGLLNDSELLPKYRRDLVGKLRALRAELTALQPQSGHCRLEVSRSEVFEESYR